MHVQSDSRTEWELLGEAARIASSLRQKLEDIYHLPTPPTPDASQLDLMIPELVLPFPHEEMAKLSALRIPPDVRDHILHAFRSRILQIQHEYRSSYRRTCLETSHAGSTFRDHFKAIHRAYQASSERHYLPMVKAHVSSILRKVAEYQKTAASEEKPVFNSEYTPFLEKYFEYNAYPSARHQSFLAEQSQMTRRQIEVWFQNHRNRAKKDGRGLKRLTTDLPLRMALDFLEDKGHSFMSRTPSPFGDDEDSTSEILHDDVEESPQSSCIEVFDEFRPQHAFPAPYPPRIDPFASDSGAFKLSPLTWMRQPAKSATAQTSHHPTSIDMDELARIFQVKLCIFEGTRKRPASSKSSRSRHPWYAATVTIPCPAPLPALLTRSSTSSNLPIPRISLLQSFTFPRATDTSRAFLCPGEASRTRKLSPLPRRVPPVPLVPTSPSSGSTVSRMSSFNSGCSSRSRSSSSSSSDRTPEPITPPQLPALDFPAVPDTNILSQRPDDFDFSFLFANDSDISITDSGIWQGINNSGSKLPRTTSLFADFPSTTCPPPGLVDRCS